MEPSVKIELTPQELGYLLSVLADRPYKEVAAFISKLSVQAQAVAQPVANKDAE